MTRSRGWTRAHEAVFTILSQHTSDLNSARAFRLLMERFGSLEMVAQGSVADIEDAISPGGLARVKAPRIKAFLNRVLELNGSLDLTFLREMPLEEAKAWLRQLPGIGPKSAGIVLNFALGMPAMGDRHPHLPGEPAFEIHRTQGDCGEGPRTPGSRGGPRPGVSRSTFR